MPHAASARQVSSSVSAASVNGDEQIQHRQRLIGMRKHVEGICYLVIFVIICTSCAKTIATQPASLNNSETGFPLALGNTWVFQVTSYAGFNLDEVTTATRIVTETVIDIRTDVSYFAVRIQRDAGAEKLESVPKSGQVALIPSGATSSEYWLVVSDNRIYRQEERLDLPNLHETGTLEFVLPLKVGEKWYLNDKMEELYPDKMVDSMLRKVMKTDAVIVPAGRFENCFLLAEVIGGSTFEKWFCPGIGLVDQRSDHHGTPYGWRQVLIEYHHLGE